MTVTGDIVAIDDDDVYSALRDGALIEDVLFKAYGDDDVRAEVELLTAALDFASIEEEVVRSALGELARFEEEVLTFGVNVVLMEGGLLVGAVLGCGAVSTMIIMSTGDMMSPVNMV